MANYFDQFDEPAKENNYFDQFDNQSEDNKNRSTLGEIGRQAGLTGRAVAGGLAQSVQPFTEPLRYALNLMLPGNPVGNIETATDEALTKVGVPEPENALERGVQSVGRFATSLGAGTGMARGAEKAMGVTLPQAVPKPSGTQQLKEYSKAAYNAADDAGVVIAPNSFKGVVESIARTTREAGIDETLHPRAMKAIKRLTEATDNPVPLKELEILRRVAKNASASIQPDEQRIAGIITDKLDDFVNGMGAPDVISGDPKAAAGAIKSARNLWSRAKKSEAIEELIGKAELSVSQFSQSGMENALRVQFRQLAKNTKKMRVFSPAEQAAIKKVANGDTAANVLRMLGKLAPTTPLAGVVSGTAGYAAGGPVGAALTLGGGMAARRGATALTAKNAENAVDLMRRGAPVVKTMSPNLPSWLIGSNATFDPLYQK